MERLDGAMRGSLAIMAAVGLGIVAVPVFIIQPGYVEPLIDLRGLDAGTAGYVAASEMTGIALTTILMSFLTHRVSGRLLLTAFVLLEAAVNTSRNQARR